MAFDGRVGFNSVALLVKQVLDWGDIKLVSAEKSFSWNWR